MGSPFDDFHDGRWNKLPVPALNRWSSDGACRSSLILPETGELNLSAAIRCMVMLSVAENCMTETEFWLGFGDILFSGDRITRLRQLAEITGE